MLGFDGFGNMEKGYPRGKAGGRAEGGQVTLETVGS